MIFSKKRLNLLFLSSIFFYAKTIPPIEGFADRIFINDNPKLIVFWSPKAACSTVLTQLCKAYNFTELENYPNVHFFFWGTYYKNHQVTSDKFFDPSYYKVKFVRCPYKRAVSSYLQHIKKFPYLAVSFKQYLELLINNLWKEYHCSADLEHAVRFHAVQQHCPYDHYMDIIKIEEPQKGLDALYNATGIKLDLNEFKNTTVYNTSETKCFADVVLTKTDTYPPYFSFYNQETLQLVETLYKEDIERFNYQCPQEIKVFIQHEL